MANPTKHEHDVKIGGKTYKIRFSNRGHREAEDMLGKSGEYIQSMMDKGVMDQRLMTALMWGGTRKNHEADLPEVDDIDDLIDEMMDEVEDDPQKMIDIMSAVMAAYARGDREAIKKGMQRGQRRAGGTVDADEAPKGKSKEKPVKAVEQQDAATG